MDRELQILLGRVLGEVLVLKARIPGGRFTNDLATAYGLLNGFETTLDEALERTGFISKEKENAVIAVLSQHFDDPAKLSTFTGFYQFEHELANHGVSRGDAILILRKLKMERRFVELIDKIQDQKHSYSPIELHHLDVELDKM